MISINANITNLFRLNRNIVKTVKIAIPFHQENLNTYLSPIIGQYGIQTEKFIENIFEKLTNYSVFHRAEITDTVLYLFSTCVYKDKFNYLFTPKLNTNTSEQVNESEEIELESDINI
jgi:hypothetical protein